MAPYRFLPESLNLMYKKQTDSLVKLFLRAKISKQKIEKILFFLTARAYKACHSPCCSEGFVETAFG